jgi:hypothetical protein
MPATERCVDCCRRGKPFGSSVNSLRPVLTASSPMAGGWNYPCLPVPFTVVGLPGIKIANQEFRSPM